MESARGTLYLFDELVAEEEELYDKRVKTLVIKVIESGEPGKRKGTRNQPGTACPATW